MLMDDLSLRFTVLSILFQQNNQYTLWMVPVTLERFHGWENMANLHLCNSTLLPEFCHPVVGLPY